MSNSLAVSGSARRRGRHTRTLTSTERLLLAVLGILLIASAAMSGHERPVGVPTTTVLVDGGDTLWSVAREHPIEGLSTAQTADLILELNDAKSPVLLDGQSLVVPSDPPPSAIALR